jgi:hypothetical protein
MPFNAEWKAPWYRMTRDEVTDGKHPSRTKDAYRYSVEPEVRFRGGRKGQEFVLANRDSLQKALEREQVLDPETGEPWVECNDVWLRLADVQRAIVELDAAEEKYGPEHVGGYDAHYTIANPARPDAPYGWRNRQFVLKLGSVEIFDARHPGTAPDWLKATGDVRIIPGRRDASTVLVVEWDAGVRGYPWTATVSLAQVTKALSGGKLELRAVTGGFPERTPVPVTMKLQKDDAEGLQVWIDGLLDEGRLAGLDAISAKDPAVMTAGEINKELDKLDLLSSKNTDAFIEAGRGDERPSDYRHKGDPLSLEANALTDRRGRLHNEIERRYGPRAPRRLPTGRGFGPIR